MFAFKILILVIAFIYGCQSEAPNQRIRFPGPTKFKQLPESVLAYQETSAPYPAAGFRPDPPFDLPTAQEPNFQPDPAYGPPNLTYGPPAAEYSPPAETYGPPEQVYGPPDETHLPPAQTAALTDSFAFHFPSTELTLPYTERLVAFRQRRRRPAAIRRPNRVLPSRLMVSVGTQPVQGFAQLPPKISSHSDRH